MSSRAESMMSGSAALEMDVNGEPVTYRPLDDEDEDKTIQAVVLKGTRYRRQDSAAPSDRYEVMDCWIRADSDSLGHANPRIWGQTNSPGDTLIIGGETWYVRKVIERAVQGLHKLRLASTAGTIQADW